MSIKMSILLPVCKSHQVVCRGLQVVLGSCLWILLTIFSGWLETVEPAVLTARDILPGYNVAVGNKRAHAHYLIIT